MEREQSAQRRHATLEMKLHRDRFDNPAHIGTMHPVDELQTIRAAQGFSSASQRTQVNHCTVYYECRRSDCPKHADQMLGTGVIFFPETNTMLGASYSARFLRGSPFTHARFQRSGRASSRKLTVDGRSSILLRCSSTYFSLYPREHIETSSREETSLRAPNNYVFPMDCLVMTVAQWYQVYSRPEYRDTYIVLPKQSQRKGKTNPKAYVFSVELYINVGQVRCASYEPFLSNV